MLLIDAHVHIYNCYDLEAVFDSAYANFKAQADRTGHGDDFTGILLLTETSRDNWFHYLANYADCKDVSDNKKTSFWSFHRTNENGSLYARSRLNKSLLIVAGRQVLTAEGLEILCLFSIDKYQDGDTLQDLFDAANKNGSLIVIPWGVGKWTGRSGRILKNWLASVNGSNFFLGDNSGRPFFWPRPWLFKKGETRGIHVLPGSDSLPIEDGFKRIGSFGFMINKLLPEQNPSQYLKTELMQKPHRIQAYGKLEGLYPFSRNQIAVRLRNR